MTRETKQERTVRTMTDQVTEHLHQLRTIIANPNAKELDVERWADSVLRNCLGYTATNGYTIRAQETKGKGRPDLTIYKGEKPFCVVEIKRFGFDLNKSNFRSGKLQLSEYLNTLGGVRWGILSNGTEWKLFDFSEDAAGGTEILSFHLKEDDEEIDLSKRGIEEACWEIVEMHETAYASDSWNEFSKEALAFSPESLAHAVLSLDSVKYIAKVIRGEHDYKANLEVLYDRLFNLMIKGLDDSVVGWNEMRETEIKKYITSQKRSGRKKKVNKTEKNAETENTPCATTPTPSTANATATDTPEGNSTPMAAAGNAKSIPIKS